MRFNPHEYTHDALENRFVDRHTYRKCVDDALTDFEQELAQPGCCPSLFRESTEEKLRRAREARAELLSVIDNPYASEELMRLAKPFNFIEVGTCLNTPEELANSAQKLLMELRDRKPYLAIGERSILQLKMDTLESHLLNKINVLSTTFNTRPLILTNLKGAIKSITGRFHGLTLYINFLHCADVHKFKMQVSQLVKSNNSVDEAVALASKSELMVARSLAFLEELGDEFSTIAKDYFMELQRERRGPTPH